MNLVRKFENYITVICGKFSKNTIALLNAIGTFLEPQFKYYPLGVSLQSVLVIFCSACKLTFLELLDKDDFFYVYHGNVCTLVLETYKLVHGLSLITMSEIFKINIFCQADRLQS